MSKIAIVLSGDQVIFTHVVPDNAHVILVPLGTPVDPVASPAPTASLPTFLEQSPPEASLPQQPLEPNSREGSRWSLKELEQLKSDLSDAEIANATGRTQTAVRQKRRDLGISHGGMRVRGKLVLWTKEEEDALLELAGQNPMPSSADYQEFVEFFPRHPQAGAIRQKHHRLLGV